MHKAKIILDKKERKTGYGVCMIQNQHMHSKKYKKVEDFIAVLNLKLSQGFKTEQTNILFTASFRRPITPVWTESLSH